MSRLTLLLLLALTAAAPALRPAPGYPPVGPATAAGAILWLHGGYDSGAEPDGPPTPNFLARLAARHYDIWRFDRPPGTDALATSGEALLLHLRTLRAQGYRRLVVAGQSRGAFVALSALAHPELVDAVAALSPAAHGTNPARRPQAISDFAARLADARAPLRFAFVQLADDPFDPDPDARIALVRAAALTALIIDRPPAPTGHMGIYDPAFDAEFGPCLADFLAAAAIPRACPR